MMIPGQALDEYEKLKKTQSQLLQQHSQYSQMLKQKQGQAQERQADLNLADRLLKVFDSRLGKPARQFLLRETAQHVGVDPKGEQFKNMSQMVLGLAPDELQGLRSMFAQNLGNAEPGQIQQTLRGIMSGQIDFNTVLNEVGKVSQVSGGQGDDTVTGQEGKDKRIVEPFQEGSPSAVRSFEENRTIMEGDKQASPQLVRALGLPNEKFRTNDLVQQGLAVPLDTGEQSKLANSINTRATGVSATLDDAVQMSGLFAGKPEVLGPAGGLVRGLQSTIRQVQGILSLANENFQDLTNIREKLDSTATPLATAKGVADRLMRSHNLQVTAENSARIQSMVLGLAYRMAIARDIPGNRLTNAIINQHLVQIGQSSSPEQFRAVLTDTVHSLQREFDETMRRQLGVSGYDIIARRLDDSQIQRLNADPQMLTPGMAGAIVSEVDARQSGAGHPAVKPSSPTIDEEQETLGKAEMERKATEIEKAETTTELAVAQDERAQRNEELRNKREERITAAQEKSQNLAEEKFQYQKDQDAKAAELTQQKKIGDAFVNLGKAIAGRFSGASIGGGGIPALPGQDVSAFRITPAPQRVPPRPPGS